MKKHEIYFSLELNKNRQVVAAECLNNRRQAILNEACVRFGGCSLFKGKGFYTYGNGKQVQENCLQLVIICESSHDVENFAYFVKACGDQESVLFVDSNNQSKFI